MGKNTSVSLGTHFEGFVESRISDGRYKNASEVIRAGLRLLEEREDKIEALRKALKEGEESGFVENFNPKEFLLEMKSRKRKNG